MTGAAPDLDNLPPGHRRLRATLEYDGTDFVGWQVQTAQRGRTVQGVVEQAVARVTGAPTRVVGAGRTDAGVHASAQVAHFDTPWPGAVSVLQRALVAVLPPDVAVTSLAEAPATFHARYSARARVYVYTLLNQPTRSPLQARTTWHIAEPLDAAAMAEAGARLVGRHDFRAFGRAMHDGGSTVRHVSEVAVAAEGAHVKVRIAANAFLRHMVRRMVFALVEVGRGRLSAADVADILAGAAPHRLQGMAPPRGLCLVGVTYEGVREWEPM